MQAKQELEARVNMGRPPAEDFLPIEARLAEMDREMALRAPVVPLPAPPARRRVRQEEHAALSVTEIRLPAAAKAARGAKASLPGTAAAAPAAAATATAKPRAARRPVAAKER
ncbi:MAG TPA: hypothetical protein VHT97_03365 [Acidimicrobiales bacterium]|nr:hypothetical protein [Acidimicrobiales bacterium]